MTRDPRLSEREYLALCYAADGLTEHEHRHNTPDGWRSFRHAHPWPTDAMHPDANRKHRHPNGEHSHPHGHRGYL